MSNAQTWWRRTTQHWRATSAIPPLDGPWTPDSRLDSAATVHTVPHLIDAVPLGSATLAVATETSVRLLDRANWALAHDFATPSRVTAVCSMGARLLVACDGLGILEIDPNTGSISEVIPPSKSFNGTCVTAMASDASGHLWFTQGSLVHSTHQWQRDLLTGGRSGQLWVSAPNGDLPQLIATDLAWPAGLHATDDSVLVSESWNCRLLRFGRRSEPSVVLADIPGYPAHLSPAPRGGILLACFAPRSSLVDFVMREPTFLKAMMAGMDERAWVAPQLRTLRHPLEQVQGGELLVFGQVKPWAPTRSYGLVALLDPDGTPQWSMHSRANGSRHGVTRAMSDGDAILVVSTGANNLSTVSYPANAREDR